MVVFSKKKDKRKSSPGEEDPLDKAGREGKPQK